MKKNIIFDFDGIVTDTVTYHFKSWKKLFEEEGIVPFTMEDYKKIDGIPRISGITTILGELSDDKINELAARKQKYYRELIASDPPSLMTGFKELFDSLKEKKYKTAIASSSKNVKFILNKLNLLDQFDAIVDGNDFKNPKPAPDIFLKGAEKLKVEPTTCVVFEDVIKGLQAGKNAGMKTIGLALNVDTDEMAPHADIVVDSLTKLTEKDISTL